MATRIDNISALARFAPALTALGYITVEQVIGAARAAPQDLANYLKIDMPALVAVFGGIAQQSSVVAHVARPRFALGVRLERIPHPAFSLMRAPGAVAALPAEVNLLGEMRPVRDQSVRGTCVAHASTAVAEHYWQAQGKAVDLSRQFLYWDCKQHDGDPDGEGTWIGIAMERLVADGCCPEVDWPYVPTQVPGNESQAPAPELAQSDASSWKLPSFQQISATSVSDIKSQLAQGNCVAFSIPVYNSWYQSDEVTRTGEITNPIPGEADVGGHAMCLVGYSDIPGDTVFGGGKFYLRNSWDGEWATMSVLGTIGYGTIPYSYIAATCREAYCAS